MLTDQEIDQILDKAGVPDLVYIVGDRAPLNYDYQVARAIESATRAQVVQEACAIARKYAIPGHILTGNFVAIIDQIAALSTVPGEKL